MSEVPEKISVDMQATEKSDNIGEVELVPNEKLNNPQSVQPQPPQNIPQVRVMLMQLFPFSQLVNVINATYDCTFKNLDIKQITHFTDGSAVEIINASTGSILATARLRFHDRLNIDENMRCRIEVLFSDIIINGRLVSINTTTL